jgi:TetR/AcrR family transcriptional regulator, cholesterol catabolism regulator
MLIMAKIIVQKDGSKKEIILTHAAELFRKKGFSAASVRELAESMGIEAPSLYNHIGSKAELLQEICFEVATDYTTHMTGVLNSTLSPSEKIANIIRFHVRKLSTDFDKVFVSEHEWKRLPQNYLEQFLAQRKAYEKNMIGIIEEGIEQKLFKKLFPSIVVLAILSAVRGLELRQRHKSEFTIEQLEDNMVQHLLHGIIK